VSEDLLYRLRLAYLDADCNVRCYEDSKDHWMYKENLVRKNFIFHVLEGKVDSDQPIEPITEDEKFLYSLGIFYEKRRDPEGDMWDGLGDEDEQPPADAKWGYHLNMNDTFYYACADTEFVPLEDIPKLADLCRRYGYDGATYYVAEKRKYDPQVVPYKLAVEYIRGCEQRRNR